MGTYSKEAQDAYDRQLIREYGGLEDIASIFSDDIVTMEEVKELALKKYITEDLIKEGQISTVFGNAGAGKTSLILYYAIEWIEKHDKQVLYINMDGDNPMSLPLQEIYGDRFINIGKGTPSKIMPKLMAINEATLTQTVLIFDTYKKFTADVNSKGANTALFEKLRVLQGKGATIIMLAHTNKDKNSHSGTADIEQDGDAMLRVSGVKEDNNLTVSIKQDGRTRWKVVAKTYDIVIDDYPDPRKCTPRESYTDIQKMENEREDTPNIVAIKEIIVDMGFPSTTDLKKVIDDNTGLSRRDAERILYAYIGRHWARQKQSDGKSYKWLVIE